MNNTIFNMGREKGITEGKAEGKAEGLAKGILSVLTARGLPVSAAQRAHITRERDLATLDRWLLRALDVVATRDLFADTTPRT